MEIICPSCTSTHDTDRATGVNLANGHLPEMHAAELGKKKKILFSNETFFQLCELRVTDNDLQKI